jgi:ribonuclease R
MPRYAHFTSPIRRYADLLVQRALIKGLRLGRDGLSVEQISILPEIGERITELERRAQQAERDAIDRYLTAFMAIRVGGRFAARISGVTRFGLFVTVTETGASGIVPFASLPDDYWQYDEREQTLTGRRTQKVYRLAQDVDVLLSEANPVTGGLVFHVLESDPPKSSGRARKAAPEKRPRRR